MNSLWLIVRFILSNVTLILFFLGLVCASISLLRLNTSINSKIILSTIIKWYILFSIGIHHLYSAFFLIFLGKYTAQFSGWAFSPFTTEVGFANLSLAIVAFIAFRSSRPFQDAVVLVTGFFLLGAFCGHIYQLFCVINHNHSNVLSFIVTDIFLPAFSFALIYLRYITNKKIKEVQ